MFIGSGGRLYGSGHEYISLVEGQTYSVAYEIDMNQEETLNRPGRGRECNDTDDSPNFSLCVERTLGKLANCSLGMMSRLDDDSGPICDRASDEFRAFKKSERRIMCAVMYL